MNAFFLMLTVFIVATGRLGDLCGRQRVLYLGVLVFAAASFLAGTAESAAFLVACRFAQGFAGAIALTCSVGLEYRLARSLDVYNDDGEQRNGYGVDAAPGVVFIARYAF